MRQLKYGGLIVPGDFVVVSYQNHLDFGWYAGNGSGTLQYYHFRSPGQAKDRYEEWTKEVESERSKWSNKVYGKGFTRKCLWKSYINSVHPTRVMKLENPEQVFTEQEDIMDYEKSKEALITLNIIKH